MLFYLIARPFSRNRHNEPERFSAGSFCFWPVFTVRALTVTAPSQREHKLIVRDEGNNLAVVLNKPSVLAPVGRLG